VLHKQPLQRGQRARPEIGHLGCVC
jgi:hypothetical protein